MQLIIGSVMLYISLNVQRLMEYVSSNVYITITLTLRASQPSNHVNELTLLFTFLVFLSATQGIYNSVTESNEINLYP